MKVDSKVKAWKEYQQKAVVRVHEKGNKDFLKIIVRMLIIGMRDLVSDSKNI